MKRINLLILIVLNFVRSEVLGQKMVTLSGFVKEKTSEELLLGVYIFTADGKYGTVSNNYGFYSLTIPSGEQEVVYSYIGYTQRRDTLLIINDTRIDVMLTPNSNDLQTVEVKRGRNQNESEKIRMSSIDVPIKQIKEIPALFGEKDVLKVIQLMPGVQSGSEGQSGIYVRGGGPDQNLIILDGATVYNAQHLFGFFSLFNGDALRSVELIKGGFPARYGGRLSSVIDMNMKDGNRDHTTGEIGIGAISSRGVLEGPFAKGKGSYLVAGRRTYVDLLIQPFTLASDDVLAGYFFYDFNAKLNYELSSRDRLYLSGYFGRDKFYYTEWFGANREDKSKAGFGWGNATTTARWNRVINSKLFMNTSLIYSNYQLAITGSEEEDNQPVFDIRYSSGIRDWSLKQDFDYNWNSQNHIRFGFAATHHLFTPEAFAIKDDFLEEDLTSTTTYNAVETGIYAEDEFHIGDRIQGICGLRISSFHVEGRNYVRPEPRLSMAYTIQTGFSAKASFASMNQYIHLLSNSGVGLPTDLWVPATDRVAPQRSQQVAAGFAKDLFDLNAFITLEGYYKTMNNIIGYKEGASFLNIENFDNSTEQVTWEDNVTSGDGRSYGAELLLQRKEGRLTGWIGYTLSWTTMQFDEINNGKRFYARYDRRHDVSVVGQFKWTERRTLSASWVYGTGNAITLPIGRYDLGRFNALGRFYYPGDGVEYTERNGLRMRAYHRADISLQFKKQLKRAVRTFEVSVYNAYDRRNPFYYFIDEVEENGEYRPALQQISIFPVLPSISWTYTFK